MSWEEKYATSSEEDVKLTWGIDIKVVTTIMKTGTVAEEAAAVLKRCC